MATDTLSVFKAKKVHGNTGRDGNGRFRQRETPDTPAERLISLQTELQNLKQRQSDLLQEDKFEAAANVQERIERQISFVVAQLARMTEAEVAEANALELKGWQAEAA